MCNHTHTLKHATHIHAYTYVYRYVCKYMHILEYTQAYMYSLLTVRSGNSPAIIFTFSCAYCALSFRSSCHGAFPLPLAGHGVRWDTCCCHPAAGAPETPAVGAPVVADAPGALGTASGKDSSSFRGRTAHPGFLYTSRFQCGSDFDTEEEATIVLVTDICILYFSFFINNFLDNRHLHIILPSFSEVTNVSAKGGLRLQVLP